MFYGQTSGKSSTAACNLNSFSLRPREDWHVRERGCLLEMGVSKVKLPK